MNDVQIKKKADQVVKHMLPFVITINEEARLAAQTLSVGNVLVEEKIYKEVITQLKKKIK